jgi:hypothetical protein
MRHLYTQAPPWQQQDEEEEGQEEQGAAAAAAAAVSAAAAIRSSNSARWVQCNILQLRNVPPLGALTYKGVKYKGVKVTIPLCHCNRRVSAQPLCHQLSCHPFRG